MTFRLVLVFCTNIYAVSRISQPGFKAVNFAKANEGRKLNGSVIKELNVDTEDACWNQCVSEDQCRSYNFGITQNSAGKFVCQLSDSDRFVGLRSFVEDVDFKYRGMQSVCESSNVDPCGEKGVCIPDYSMDSFTCICDNGYGGIPCEAIKSCSSLPQHGFSTSSRVYHIIPDGGTPLQVLCDMTTDGGGWIVFQRRFDGSVDFYRGWESYKNGFGNLTGEFWLGNDNLHRLTAADDVILRVDLEDFEGNISYAEYTTFKVAGEADKYRITIGGYSGTAGDSMKTSANKSLSNMQFSTKDADNDHGQRNCAELFKGAWWYRHCSWANLNGLYRGGPYINNISDGAKWVTFKGHYYSLKRTEMKLKPKT